MRWRREWGAAISHCDRQPGNRTRRGWLRGRQSTGGGSIRSHRGVALSFSSWGSTGFLQNYSLAGWAHWVGAPRRKGSKSWALAKSPSYAPGCGPSMWGSDTHITGIFVSPLGAISPFFTCVSLSVFALVTRCSSLAHQIHSVGFAKSTIQWKLSMCQVGH